MSSSGGKGDGEDQSQVKINNSLLETSIASHG